MIPPLDPVVCGRALHNVVPNREVQRFLVGVARDILATKQLRQRHLIAFREMAMRLNDAYPAVPVPQILLSAAGLMDMAMSNAPQ